MTPTVILRRVALVVGVLLTAGGLALLTHPGIGLLAAGLGLLATARPSTERPPDAAPDPHDEAAEPWLIA